MHMSNTSILHIVMLNFVILIKLRPLTMCASSVPIFMIVICHKCPLVIPIISMKPEIIRVIVVSL